MSIHMPSFDEHLEAVLEDCNNRINNLEDSGGSDEEYLDALINRGSVLSMMEYYTAAISDFDDAVELITNIEKNGGKVDAGSFIKTLVSRGELYGPDDSDSMAEDYMLASTRLRELNENSKHFDRKRIIATCLNCTEDLIDIRFSDAVSPFVDKLYELLVGRDDVWSRNRYLETLNLSAQAMSDMELQDEALEYYSDAIEVGNELLEKGALEDHMALVFPFVSRGDIEQEKGILEPYFADRKAAIGLLEELLAMNKLDDIQILVGLHQDVASTYLTLNRVKEAEEHLMREVMLNMEGAEEYIREYVDKRDH